MELWEYQVIHLNVEAPAPPASGQAPSPVAEPPPAPAPAKPEAVFSKEYLEKEFPGFYGPAPAPAQEHPAQQLRGFLNLQGREGWQLLGFYPVGQLTMMIFRRPLRTERDPNAAAATQEPSPPPEPTTTSPAPVPAAATTTPAAARTGDPEPPLLNRLLQRLEALEHRLAATDGAEEGARQERALEGDDARAALAGLSDGAILPEKARRALAGLAHISTAEAARALGFRSTASLFNRAARSGYRPGLIKRGANGRVAIYMGSERNDHGGRERRLWVVMDSEPA